MKRRFTLGIPAVLAVVVFGLSLAGCATTVSLPVQRLPTMNTAGIKRITIMPFESADGSALQQELATQLTNTATAQILKANYFTVVDPSEVQRLQDSGQSLENHIDAQFIGQVISVSITDGSHQADQLNLKTGTTTKVTMYDRKIEVSFSYNFKRTRDGSLVGVVTRRGTFTDSSEDQSGLKSQSALISSIAADQLKNLAHEVAPYTTNEKRTLKDETSSNKELKNRMKEVRKIVEKDKSYRQALDEYLSIYEQYNSFAAAYNAGLLYEVMGELDNAVDQMQKLHDATGNPDARKALDRLKQAVADREALTGVYQDSRSRNQVLIDQMVAVILSNLPDSPNVAVMNTSKTEIDLAGIIADGITSGLAGKVTLVDRTNGALLKAEQDYQMSGNVSDDSFVGIGNEIGANTLILVAVTGESSLRRLQIRILDVAKNTIIYQSPQDDTMNL